MAVIGLGQMGARLAQAFLAAGYRTTVWNRTDAKADALVAQGAVRAASAAEAVGAAPLAVVCLTGHHAVRDVLATSTLQGRTVVNLASGAPDEARDLAAWVSGHGAAYLDGAAMSGTRLVGPREALFIFSGSADAFAEHQGGLASLGNAVHLGADPALASLYDGALFGLAWGTLAGFYHAVALVAAEGVDATGFASVATSHMPFVTSLMTEHARQIQDGRYPDDDGTVDVHAAAMAHLLHASAAAGIRTDVPELFTNLLERASAAGHGAAGVASTITTLSKGAAA
ncbi:NAD(P)-dependent oxidoreductase [Nonomuraea longispora]|nr:NAD(P)-binding domain-containing protein [Nonomuraea longispora]